LGEVLGLPVCAAAAMAAVLVRVSVGHLLFCWSTSAVVDSKVTRLERARQAEHAWTNDIRVFSRGAEGKIVLIYLKKNTSLDLSGTRLGYFS